MAHGLETMARLDAEAIAEYKQKHATTGVAPLAPMMREMQLQKLLAALDLSIHAGHLSMTSFIAQARLAVGPVMPRDEASRIVNRGSSGG